MGILFLKKGHSKILLREKNFLSPPNSAPRLCLCTWYI